MEDIAAAPPGGPKSALLFAGAWAMSVGLMATGLLGLNTDLEFVFFDIACVLVGFFAAPPVTDRLRARLKVNFGGGAHLASAAALLVVAAVADWNRGAAPAPFPVATHAQLQSFGAVTPAPDPQEAAERAMRKDNYLSQIAARMDDLNAAGAAAQSVGEPEDPIVIADALSADDALVARRREFALAPPERALVDRFAANVAAARQAALPDLRRAFVANLNAPLAQYGLSARITDEGALEFDGAALTDPSKRALLLSLTQDQRAALGLRNVVFALAAPAPTAVMPAAAPAPDPPAQASKSGA